MKTLKTFFFPLCVLSSVALVLPGVASAKETTCKKVNFVKQTRYAVRVEWIRGGVHQKTYLMKGRGITKSYCIDPGSENNYKFELSGYVCNGPYCYWDKNYSFYAGRNPGQTCTIVWPHNHPRCENWN